MNRVLNAAHAAFLPLILTGCVDPAGVQETPDLATLPDLLVTFPAGVAEFPQAESQGGRLLYAPDVVLLTTAGDPFAASLLSFHNDILKSAWWTSVTAEYCDAMGRCIGNGQLA